APTPGPGAPTPRPAVPGPGAPTPRPASPGPGPRVPGPGPPPPARPGPPPPPGLANAATGDASIPAHATRITQLRR
ncbi:MAG: hypothetical protein EBR23_05125, partial [Planctomycetia bacterium]|nr:hypothetical protein [Planctomycetia bacterium]